MNELTKLYLQGLGNDFEINKFAKQDFNIIKRKFRYMIQNIETKISEMPITKLDALKTLRIELDRLIEEEIIIQNDWYEISKKEVRE